MSSLLDIRKFILIALSLAALLAGACQSRSELEKMAASRLPQVVEREFRDKMGIVGVLELAKLKTVYDRDWLCLLQCVAVYPDSTGTTTVFPLRYVLIKDQFMSLATGKPSFNEGLFFSELLTDQQIKSKRKELAAQGSNASANFIGMTLPVSDEPVE